MSVQFFSEETEFIIDNPQSIRKWIHSAIEDKGFVPGTLNYIFCSDDYLLSINKQYLNHDTYTDIITFDYAKGKIVSGDIFISIDRVKENATKFHKTFENELCRVIIHGVLHLCGLKDKSTEDSHHMRAEEDFYLDKIN